MKYWWVIAIGVVLNTVQGFYLHHRWSGAQEQKRAAIALAEAQERERLEVARLEAAAAAKRRVEERRRAEENACVKCFFAVLVGGAVAAADGGATLAVATSAITAGASASACEICLGN